MAKWQAKFEVWQAKIMINCQNLMDNKMASEIRPDEKRLSVKEGPSTVAFDCKTLSKVCRRIMACGFLV
jgi:hypothetical protein